MQIFPVPYRESVNQLIPYKPDKPSPAGDGPERPLINLSANENPLGCSPAVWAAVIRTEAFAYPDGGCYELRAALAKRLGIQLNELVFGCGADEVLSMIGKVFVEKGDECITGAVAFSTYTASAESMGGRMVYVPMKNHGFDLDGILEAITEKTKIIFLTNPNNPTGTMFTRDEQTAFIRRLPPRVLLVLDEAYGDFAAGDDYPDSLPLIRSHQNIIILKTFSKLYGLASFRVGYGIACPQLIDLLERVRSPFNVSSQGQAAALAALGDWEFCQETLDNNQRARAAFCRGLAEIGLPFIPSRANFVMVDTGRDSRDVFKALLQKGYIVRNGTSFGMPTYLRVSIGTESQIQGLLQALREVLRK